MWYIRRTKKEGNMHHYKGEKACLDEDGTEIFDQPERSLITAERGKVVMDNLLARATTRWSLEETKLFLIAVSKIDTIDANHEVKIPKDTVMRLLGWDPTNRSKLRALAKKVAEKSWVEFNGPREDIWEDGFLVVGARSDIKNIYIEFRPRYLPMIQNLSKHFTQFNLIHILGFKHKSALALYMYLVSWHDPRYLNQTHSIPKKDLVKIFNLKEGQYWRNYGTDQDKFDWPYFERRVIKPAVKDINEARYRGTCDMLIENWKKQKDGKTVLGYTFYYGFYDKHGTQFIETIDGELIGEEYDQY